MYIYIYMYTRTYTCSYIFIYIYELAREIWPRVCFEIAPGGGGSETILAFLPGPGGSNFILPSGGG